MGCDIHGTIEKKVGVNKWVMVNRLHYKQESMKRHYGRFAALAGVRGDGPEPQGIPSNISEGTQLYIDVYGDDGHSHSYMEITQAAALLLAVDKELKTLPDNFMDKYPISEYFDIDLEETCGECKQSKNGEYRFIFWFDN